MIKTSTVALALGLAGVYGVVPRPLGHRDGEVLTSQRSGYDPFTPRTTATFTGTLSAISGARMVGVRLALTTVGDTVVYETTTDGDGAFAFEEIRPGQYIVVIRRSDFMVELNRLRLVAGQHAVRQLTKGVVIAGTVLDERGAPVPTVTVCLLRQGTEALRRRFSPTAWARTSARGRFVIGARAGLGPGAFIAAVMPAGCDTVARPELVTARLARYPPAYFPDTSSPTDASIVKLDEHEDREFPLRLRPGPVTRLEGKIGGYLNTTVVPSQVILEPPIGDVVSIIRTTRVNADGSFAFAALVPGEYRVILPPHRGPDPPRWAERTVTLRGEPVARVPLAAQPTVALGGTVDFAGHLTALYGTRIFLTVDVTRIGERPSTLPLLPNAFAAVGTDGKFGLSALMPGTYRLSVHGAEAVGWRSKSAMVPTADMKLPPIDAFDVPITLEPNRSTFGVLVEMTYKVNTLSGRIEDEEGRPTSQAFAVIFSPDARYWVPRSRRITWTKAGGDGTFMIDGLPQGEYLALPVRELPAWPDPGGSSRCVPLPCRSNSATATGEKLPCASLVPPICHSDRLS